MRLSYISLLATFFFSCSSNRNTTTNNQVLLLYESGSCYGKCEVFKFKINENKTIEYEGLKNVEKTGKYRAEISVNDFNEIEELISKVDLTSTDSVYTSNSTDLHLRILNLNRKKLNKKFLLYNNIPFELKQVENKVIDIIEKYKTKFSREL
jgi:hypothetical protein